MEPTCATVAYGPLAACLRDRGVVDAWLSRMDLREEELRTPDRRLSFSEMCKAWRSAVELTGDERIGLHAGASFRPGTLDVFDHLMRARETLLDAGIRGKPFITLLSEVWSYELEVHDVESKIVLCPPPGIELLPQMLEYPVALCVTLCRSIAGSIDPSEVHFTHEVEDDALHREVFRAAVRFRMPQTGIVVATKVVQKRLRSADPSLVRVLERFVSQLDAPSRGRTRDRVSQLIAERLPEATTASKIAKLMSMSERTLRRKLQAESTSFSAVLDDVRRRLALAFLSDDVPIQIIAERLGYFDPSSFHKAFKRWTGKSPSSYRSDSD